MKIPVIGGLIGQLIGPFGSRDGRPGHRVVPGAATLAALVELVALVALAALALAGCSNDDPGGPAERPVPVTAAIAEVRTVERTETAVGRLEANNAPEVAAETSGRVVQIHANAGDRVSAGDLLAELDAETQRLVVNSSRAEIRRLEALADNARMRVQRLTRLAELQSVSEDQLDQAETELAAFQAQLAEATARLEDAEFNLARTRIVSPVDGEVQRRLVSTGDFVAPGRVLFGLVSPGTLRAVLPLPEHLQDNLETGLPVRLGVPARPGQTVDAVISEIRPSVGAASRAVDVIVDLDNPGGWRPGGSVTGQVILQARDSVTVPGAAVVRRPAGRVVYVIDGDRARERQVRTGLSNDFGMEILEGVEAGERVVVDGAGFLSDGALLDLHED